MGRRPGGCGVNRRPRFPTALDRPRLRVAAAAPCVIINAPAGGGKTVLAAQLADAAAGRALWLRPEAPQATAAELVDAACRLFGRPRRDHAADPVALAETLLDAAGDKPFLLVLDEADRAEAADLARLLAELVPLLEEGQGVLVCVRTRPAGLLGRLGSDARLLDAAALAFTAEEIAQLLDCDSARATDAHAATGGWPLAVSLARSTNTAPGTRAALSDALGVAVADDPGARAALDLLALAGSAPAEVLTSVLARTGWDAAAPDRLAARTPLVQLEGGRYRLADAARATWRPVVPAAEVAAFADRLAEHDPAVAVDLLLDAGLADAAAWLLTGAVGRLPVDWVRPRLYRLPAPVRRALPPALSAIQATVDLGSAIAHAERAVAQARTPGEHAAARFALGSALAHSGELEQAAVELAAAGQGTPDPTAAALADGWLALVRLWSGDLAGAAAAAEPAAAKGTTLAGWVLGQCALARANLPAARRAADLTSAGTDLGPALGLALAAQIAVHAAGGVRPGGPDAELAERAYRLAVPRGGLELLAAAPVHAWFLLAAGRPDEAVAVATALRSAVGRQDAASRLQSALVRLAAARLTGDADAERTASTTVLSVRRNGFAHIEAEARRFAPGLASARRGLRVRLLGSALIEVDGRAVAAESWRSRKAREALLLLAGAGPAGLRRDEVVEAVWPGREPGRGRTLLRTALVDIRRVLEPDRPAGEPSAFLHADRERVRLIAEVDVVAARDHAAAGRLGEALAMLGAEVAEPEPDLAALDPLRSEVSALRLNLGRRIGGDTQLAVARRVGAYEAVLAVQPWQRALAEDLVALLWRAGDAAAAQAADARYLIG